MKDRKAAARTETAKDLKVNERKWSKPLMDAGWTAIPSVIIERQRALGLDALDINILLHLATYWWTHDNKPHPAKGTIAEAMNVKPRTVQRRIAALENAGLIWREEIVVKRTARANPKRARDRHRMAETLLRQRLCRDFGRDAPRNRSGSSRTRQRKKSRKLIRCGRL